MNWRSPDGRPTGQSPVFLRSSRWLVEQCLKVKVADVQARYGKDQIWEAATGTRQLWWPLAPGYCQEVQVAIRPHPHSGHRTWLVCPLCQRTVGCLYVPLPMLRQAGLRCRRCWGLVYVGQRHFRNRFYQQVLRPLARVSRLRRLLQKQARRAGREDLRREEQRLAVIEQNLRALKPVGLLLKEQWQARVCAR
jgi:hypothetical protein